MPNPNNNLNDPRNEASSSSRNVNKANNLNESSIMDYSFFAASRSFCGDNSFFAALDMDANPIEGTNPDEPINDNNINSTTNHNIDSSNLKEYAIELINNYPRNAATTSSTTDNVKSLLDCVNNGLDSLKERYDYALRVKQALDSFNPKIYDNELFSQVKNDLISNMVENVNLKKQLNGIKRIVNDSNSNITLKLKQLDESHINDLTDKLTTKLNQISPTTNDIYIHCTHHVSRAKFLKIYKENASLLENSYNTIKTLTESASDKEKLFFAKELSVIKPVLDKYHDNLTNLENNTFENYSERAYSDLINHRDFFEQYNDEAKKRLTNYLYRDYVSKNPSKNNFNINDWRTLVTNPRSTSLTKQYPDIYANDSSRTYENISYPHTEQGTFAQNNNRGVNMNNG